MANDEAHNSYHILLASKPIRVKNEADTSNLSTDPTNQSHVEFYFDDDMHCPQCGQDHRYKTTAGGAIQEMISFLDRDVSDDI